MKQSISKALIILFLITCIFQTSPAQYNYSQYKFLNLPENKFKHLKDSTNFNKVMNQFQAICLGKKKQINIVHIGNSHIQGGFLTNELKTNFHNYFLNDTTAHAGFIFPYQVAKTNTPANYRSEATGEWSTCKATEADSSCSIGASGISIFTHDSSATVQVKLQQVNPFKNPDFSFMRVLCENTGNSYKVKFNPKANKIIKDSLGYLVHFSELSDSIKISITKKNNKDSSKFILHGFIPGNYSAINYYALGVNGAKAESYLKCSLFQKHLEILSPDWVIISLGTNEAYNRKYKKKLFIRYLGKLINKIRVNNPETWIMLTTPGDALRSGRLKNPNNKIAGKNIIHVAKKHHCSYWNFYKVMGGEGSVEKWSENNLTARDKLHLNKKGYILKAHLFFDAFLEAFLPHLKEQISKE
jgi:hypothetical protein